MLAWRSLWCGLAVAVPAALGFASAAGAAALETLLTPSNGSPTQVRVFLSEDAGSILFEVHVEQGLGDLRGLFFDVASDGLLDGLQASGEFVTGFETGDRIDLGQGNNLHGGDSPCPCDVGVAFGTPGIGKDDIRSTSFVLSHATIELTIADLLDQLVGARVTSVGDEFGREASLKLANRFPAVPIPEPASALLVALGLSGLGLGARRRRR